jgi:hypothetical protein
MKQSFEKGGIRFGGELAETSMKGIADFLLLLSQDSGQLIDSFQGIVIGTT